MVDDDHFDRMLLRRCLGRDRPHLRIDERASLTAARDYLARNRADLIVLDHRLPDGKGADFAAELRRDEALRDTMICVVTSQDIQALDAAVPALSKDGLDSGALWSLVGEYLSICDIASGSDEALAVKGFGEAMQDRLVPQLSRMLRSVRSARAALGNAGPRRTEVELERLEETILSLSDWVTQTRAPMGGAQTAPTAKRFADAALDWTAAAGETPGAQGARP
ncbi:response regulator [Ponticoccus alexandrii]|uniref:response regulator n=1 Tax=Ponticoccus alexandrii TaxID=1943633 RepID=UPI0003D1BBA7|nr:response regulator [Ponticoccus alexandrii]